MFMGPKLLRIKLRKGVGAILGQMSHTFCDIFISLETKIVTVYK